MPQKKDAETSLENLKKEAENFVIKRDWEKYHNPKDLTIALSVEVAELLDVFKWKPKTDPSTVSEHELDKIREEIADITIYLLHIANALSIDLTDCVTKKMEKNKQKYPETDSGVRNRW